MQKKKWRYLELFLIFSRISLFTIGGGLVMLSLVERELVRKRGWLDKSEFLDVLSISQTLPGTIIVNFATSVGYRIAGWRGAFYSALGAVIPPFLAIVLFASFLFAVRDAPLVEHIFGAVRPAAIALISVLVLDIWKSSGFKRNDFLISSTVIILFVFAGVSPVYIIIAALSANLLFVWRGARKR